MAPSFSERQAQYAAWRDRMRQQDEGGEPDEGPGGDKWDSKHLFQSDGTIDLDATVIDLDSPVIDLDTVDTSTPDRS